jgi:hypothetical protein
MSQAILDHNGKPPSSKIDVAPKQKTLVKSLVWRLHRVRRRSIHHAPDSRHAMPPQLRCGTLGLHGTANSGHGHRGYHTGVKATKPTPEQRAGGSARQRD